MCLFVGLISNNYFWISQLDEALAMTISALGVDKHEEMHL